LSSILAGLAVARAAAADDTSACIAASEAAQSMRDRRELLEAREKFAACSRDVCPRPVRADCMQQRTEVDAAIPTVVLRAKDARGEDAVDVKVFCDGAVLATQLDGKARPVNPGAHTFRFEIDGVAPFERKVVVGEGEKNRLVVGEAPHEAAPPNSEVPGAQPSTSAGPVEVPANPTPSEAAADASGHALSIPGLIAGGIGVAATIPMAILWVSGTNAVHQMRGTCAPAAGGAGCDASRVDSARTQLVLGDVFLGVSVVGVVTGAVLIFTHLGGHHEEAAPAATALRLDASPLPGGAFVSALASF
jgi:hypothetical protein